MLVFGLRAHVSVGRDIGQLNAIEIPAMMADNGEVINSPVQSTNALRRVHVDKLDISLAFDRS